MSSRLALGHRGGDRVAESYLTGGRQVQSRKGSGDPHSSAFSLFTAGYRACIEKSDPEILCFVIFLNTAGEWLAEDIIVEEI